jgi:hypothetical protein
LVFSRLQQLYKFRHNDKTDGLDTYVASIMSKPFPNPTTAVEPIKDEPDTATTTSTGSTTTPGAATTKTTAASTTTTVKTPAEKKPRNR